MITRDMKISKMLELYPGTLEVLLNTSPHFNKLKNKLLRKALASRVTVEQAASIAGVEAGSLLFNLNKAVNPISTSQFAAEKARDEISKPDESLDDFLNYLKDKKIITLDVRPIIASGTDPFRDIMAKVKSLKDDNIFLLINSFEPVPLYTVLGKKHYEHKTIKKGDEFNVYFFRKDNLPVEGINGSEKSSGKINTAHDYENVIEIDVRELEPPEPMLKVLETLSNVDDKTLLVVHHHREPLMLYPKLEERGYEAVCSKINENYFKIIISKKNQQCR